MSEKDRLLREIEMLKAEVFAVRDANAKMAQRMGEAEANAAAAEERGRWAGIEERDELRALLAECKIWLCSNPKLEDRIDAALAPRDSGKTIPSVASHGCPECSKPKPGDLGMGSIEARQLRCTHGRDRK